jgi:hypothetical protein
MNLIFLQKEGWFATLLDLFFLFCQNGNINILLQGEETGERSLRKSYQNLCCAVGDRQFLTAIVCMKIYYEILASFIANVICY